PVEEAVDRLPALGPFDVDVSPDDDRLIAQLRHVDALADSRTERDAQGPDLLAREDLVETRLLDVEHLAEHRQDGLEAAIAPGLGRAAGRIPFDDINLAPLRVTLLAVGQLAGQGHPLERPLADDEIALLAGRL